MNEWANQMAKNFSLAQGDKEILWAAKGGHSYIGVAHFPWQVGIAPCARQKSILASEGTGFS